MDKLQEWKNQLERANEYQLYFSGRVVKEIIQMVEQLEEENAAMAEKHAEKDLALMGAMQRIEGLEAIKAIYLGANNVLLKENELYKLQEARLILQIQKLQEENRKLKQVGRATKYFEMAEENLKMAAELERLKGRRF